MIKKYITSTRAWKARSAEEYFNLPIMDRQKFGWYLRPGALMNNDWVLWTERIRRQYPIQGFVREWLFDYDNPVYAKIEDTLRCIRRYYRYSRKFLNPDIPRARKTIPRHWHIDIGDALQDFVFALILDYVYDKDFEYKMNDQDPEVQDFNDWISDAVEYIELGRRHIEEDIEAIWEAADNEVTGEKFREIFEQTQRLELQKLERDTAILVECMKYRHRFV